MTYFKIILPANLWKFFDTLQERTWKQVYKKLEMLLVLRRPFSNAVTFRAFGKIRETNENQEESPGSVIG